MTDHYVESFDPREYLRQYYSLPELAADDADLFRTLTGWLRREGRTFATALDVGCGPTIHNTFAIAPYAERIDLADYLPGNLAEVRKWLDGDPGAHDWDALFRGVLACEGTPGDELATRKTLYRKRVAALRACNLRDVSPISENTSGGGVRPGDVILLHRMRCRHGRRMANAARPRPRPCAAGRGRVPRDLS